MVDMSPSLITRCSLGRSVLANVCTALSVLSKDLTFSRNMTTYSLVGSVADLLAHELVHPLVGLVVVAAVGRETGDDERHVWMFGCCMVLVLCNVVLSMS
jgi:hypothetical protein